MHFRAAPHSRLAFAGRTALLPLAALSYVIDQQTGICLRILLLQARLSILRGRKQQTADTARLHLRAYWHGAFPRNKSWTLL